MAGLTRMLYTAVLVAPAAACLSPGASPTRMVVADAVFLERQAEMVFRASSVP